MGECVRVSILGECVSQYVFVDVCVEVYGVSM